VKSQTDMIVSIVAVLLALIMAGVFFGTKPDPQKPAPPQAVNVTAPQYPPGSVVFANGLGGSSTGAPGAGGGGGLARPAGGGAPAPVHPSMNTEGATFSASGGVGGSGAAAATQR
jgi:hypothetical protein